MKFKRIGKQWYQIEHPSGWVGIRKLAHMCWGIYFRDIWSRPVYPTPRAGEELRRPTRLQALELAERFVTGKRG